MEHISIFVKFQTNRKEVPLPCHLGSFKSFSVSISLAVKCQIWHCCCFNVWSCSICQWNALTLTFLKDSKCGGRLFLLFNHLIDSCLLILGYWLASVQIYVFMLILIVCIVIYMWQCNSCLRHQAMITWHICLCLDIKKPNIYSVLLNGTNYI